MKKRVFSFLMAAMILFSAVPAEAFAAGSSEAEELYFIDDTIWLAEGEEPSAPVVETGKWVKTEETKTASVLCCSEEEHTHLQNCPVADDGSFACGGHIHTDSCYAKVYDHDAHAHTEECSADAACTLQEHIHTDECAFVLGELTCGQAEHTHVTNGCDEDCALAEHSHSEACQQTVTLVKWVVTLKEDSYTPHAADSRITDGVGTVVISGHIDWKELDSSCRPSAVEVYLYADNVRIAAQTVTAPDWAYSFDISKGVPDGKGGYTSPIGVNFEIREQELPGYNKPAIVHPVLNFTPPSAGSGWKDQNPCNKLEWNSSDGSYAVIAAKTTSSGPLVIWTPFALAEFEREIILTSLEQNASGLGNPKSTLFLSGEGVESEYGLIADSSTLVFTNTSVWSKFWTGSYSQGYTDVTDSSIVYTQKAQQITGKKVWNDANDLDGIRPDKVVVHLLKNSLHEGNPVTLNESNGWEGSWTVPTHDKDGIPYIYHVEEVIPQGYTCQVSGSAETGFTLTNIHTPEKVSVVAHKIWEDDENRDGIRPNSITVQLYSQAGENGTKTAVGSPVSIAAANYWTYEWDELDAHSNGTPIIYSVKETQVSGYNEPRYTTDTHTGRLVITNSRDVGKINVAVNKVWNDQNNRDGIRPDKVTVTLYANGIPLTSAGTTVELDADNNWSYTWTDLYEYYQGNKIAYTVAEQEVAEGYTASVNRTTAENGDVAVTITNTHTPETISVPVNKVWNDGDNQDGIRPASVEAKLLADGQPTDETLTLNAANNWAGSFDNMPKYKAGAVKQAITYTVVETSVPDYTATVTGDAENGYTVTNTHTPMVATLSVKKVWEDADNQDGKRPTSVEVTLYANGHPLLKDSESKLVFEQKSDETGYTRFTLTLNDENNWTDAWENMPRYHNGQRVSYTVVETGHDGTPGLPAGYTVTHQYAGTNTTNGTATITNSYTPEQTSINVQKVWDDEDNRDGKRPESITVTLWQKIGDGEWTATNRTAVLNPANEWDHDFTGLPKYYNGTKILYNVVETTNDTNYLGAEYAYDPATGVVTVTNKRAVERTSVSVTKEWYDANNQDGIRPEKVLVTLYANGTRLTSEGTTVELSAANDWSYTWDDLYKNYRGKEVVYTVAEAVPNGYTAVTTGNASTGYTITNTHTPETISVPVNKVWNDGDNQDGIRPDSVTVNLLADNVDTGKTLTLNAAGNWAGSFDNMPKYKAGETGVEIVYSVVEPNVPEGYTVSYDGTTVTNSHTPIVAPLTVNKVWNDANDQDGKRPEEVTVTLYANGHPLMKGANGPDFAAATGTPYTLILSNNNWTGSWMDMPRYHNGQRVSYTVVETSHDGISGLPEGYTVNYTYDLSTNTTTVTNNYTPQTTFLNVVKRWDDANNQDAIRPYGVVIQLFADGKEVENQTAVLSADNNWDYTFTNLPKNKQDGDTDADSISYTVKEIGFYETADDTASSPITELEGYSVEYETTTDAASKSVNVINIHEVAKTSVSVTKVWEDENDRDGIRPDSVQVTLYRNGENTGETLTLNAANNWTGTFEDLDVHHGIGIDNVYTVAETVPTGYTAEVSGDAENGYTITNIHTPETISVPVNKVWNDGDNQDGIRPASVTVKLLADNEDTGKTLTLSAANNWQAVFTELDKYEENEVGKGITYTVKETVPDGYTAEVTGDAENGYTVTNSHTPMVATLTVNKVWEDADNQDGKRPNTVTVTLYANGHPLLKDSENKLVFEQKADETGYTRFTLTLNDENNWTDAWENMPRYHNGQRVSYTVVETGHNGQAGLPEGYTVTHQYAETDTTNGTTATITNSYTPEQTSINVQKVWDDEDNRDGRRPNSVEVKLMRSISKDNDGKNIWEDVSDETATLNPDNEWDHDFTGLPKYYNGTEILYNVVETTRDTNYPEAEYAYDPATGVVTVTNKRTVDKVSVSVTKVWDDANNQDGIRPESVNVTLYANGYELTARGTTVTLKASNNWTYTWNNLYKNYHGQPIVYTVAEAVPTGYTAEVSGNASTGYTITNTHEVEKVDIPVSKTWADEDNRDGIRPASVEVKLLADGQPTDEILTLNAANNWAGSFDNMPKYKAGAVKQAITYTVEENAVDDYTATVTGDAENGFTVTNTHDVELTAFTVVKQWIDDGNRDGKRPASINLHLLANGIHMNEQFPDKRYMVSLTSAADGTWQYTWNDLYKNRGGQAIRYTVYEEPIYPADSSTNTVDANGEPIAPQAATLYTTTYVRNSDTQDTVINTYVPETVEVTVTKIWDDGNDRDGLRPESITVTLCGDGAAVQTATLNAANNWSYSWTALPKYKDGGTPIVYTVQEPSVPEGYTCAIKEDHGADAANDNAVPNYHYFVMTNTHVPETTSVSVTKKWNDDNNNDGKRPDGLIVQLFADGSEVPNGMAVLSAINNWSYTWPANMPLYVYKTTWDDTGAKSTGNIRYSVREIGYVMGSTEYTGLPDGYTGTDIMEGFNVTLTNTRESEKVSVEVSKVWDDGNDRDAIRPASVQVTLKKNDTAVETVTLDASNGWAYKWDNLKRYDGGAIADYTVEEAAVEGYTVSYSKAADAAGNVTVTITNTHEPTTHGGGGGGSNDGSITKTVIVSKVWEDNSNIEGLRPQRVVLRLYKNGKAYGDKIVLSEANCWNKAVTLPVYEDGDKIQWTVRELKIPRYYTVSYNQRSLTVTNTLQSKTIPKTGDTSNLLLWLLLMGVCGAGIGAVLLLNNKKKRYRR